MTIIPRDEWKGLIDAYGNPISYETYESVMRVRKSLPVATQSDEIKCAVKWSVIVIVEAETGSGKSTQIPQYIYELLVEMGLPTHIDVTLPRVIPAISLATRISTEMLCSYLDPRFSLGWEVGYRTGKDRFISGGTSISINTDGLQLMRQFHGKKFVPNVLFIDEVHEQSIPTAFLLGLVKEALLAGKNPFKLVLSSATMDIEGLQDFFRPVLSDIPTLRIPGRLHPVTRTIIGEDGFYNAIIEYAQSWKNVLVFVEGKPEITEVIATLRTQFPDKTILPMHSQISTYETRQIMQADTTNGVIIVATNVAESSLTIPYINAVVDRGRCKTMLVNPQGIKELRMTDISHAQRTQRSWRAGRTEAGFSTTANDTPPEKLRPYPLTPIEHSTLERYILISLAQGVDLRKKLFKKKKNEKFLLREPNENLVNVSYENLKLLGAIDDYHKITALGYEILQYPLEPNVARMLVEGIHRGCSEYMIWIAAILNADGFLGKQTWWKDLGIKPDQRSDLKTHLSVLQHIVITEPNRTIVSRVREALKVEVRALKMTNMRSVLAQIDRECDTFLEENSRLPEPRRLFEVIDLSLLGIKTRRVHEILATVEQLRQRVIEQGAEKLSTGHDDESILLSILSGSMQHIFRYGDRHKNEIVPEDRKTKAWNGKRKSRRDSDRDRAAFYTADLPEMGFRAANTSTVSPSRKGIYVGSPLIVETKNDAGDVRDLAILTGITRVTEAHLRKLKYSGFVTGIEWTEEVGKRLVIKKGAIERGNGRTLSPRSRKNIATPELMVRVRESVAGMTLREEWRSIGTTDPTLLARDWLPDYLIENNLPVKRFLARMVDEYDLESIKDLHDVPAHALRSRIYAGRRSQKQGLRIVDIARFRELLRKVTVHHGYKIDTRRPERLMQTFMHDTEILQDFQGSNDPAIIAFLRNPYVSTKEKGMEVLGKSDE